MTVTAAERSVAPGPILQIASGYRQAKVLFAAYELDVFTILDESGPLTEAEFTTRAGLHPNGARDFLYALLGLGLVEREDGRYRNAAAARQYLVRGRPDFLGGFLGFLDGVLHPAWDGLVTSLRTGEARNGAGADGDPYGPMYQASGDRDGFLAAMDTLNAPIGEEVAALDWAGFRTFADIGGARGNLSAAIARAHPHLSGTVFDLPGVAPAFDTHIRSLGLDGRLRFRAGDFFADELPEADVLVFGHVLHNWPVESRILLLQKAFRAVRPGGAVLVYDPMIDDDAPQLGNVLASLNMLVWSAGGAEYSVADLRSWLGEAGFGETEVRPLGAASSLVLARKP
ncbi:methyltransferase [Amycolatopsis sp. lyj-23]|uniref:methyltransferase n=1 Tax=Amycolatopsis sp. lyj-23 TaxID=2789283 RepID=UPI00397864EF